MNYVIICFDRINTQQNVVRDLKILQNIIIFYIQYRF